MKKMHVLILLPLLIALALVTTSVCVEPIGSQPPVEGALPKGMLPTPQVGGKLPQSPVGAMLLPPSGFKPGMGREPLGSPPETGYTLWQEAAMEGFEIGFHLGQTYAMAQQGYNINGFNAEVDNYNAWVRQNFGNGPNLMMPKMQAGMPSYAPQGMPSYVPQGMPGYVPQGMLSYVAQTNPTIVFRDPLGWV
jgi:hypothetical protein